MNPTALRISAWACAAALALLPAGCGYRSVVSQGGYELETNERFAPFLVRNVTPDIGLTHVVGTAVRQELGRRDRLGSRDGEGLYEVRVTVRGVGQRAVAFAPNGSVIEYLGELRFDYRVFAPGTTSPLAVVNNERLWYRYHFHSNPHILQQHRDAALADAVRSWVPRMLMYTSAAAGRQQTGREQGRETPAPTEDGMEEHDFHLDEAFHEF